MDKRKFNKGVRGNKGGRPSKAEEQKLIERLTPLMPEAYKALKQALKDNQGWAVKIAFEYMYGKPKQTIEQTNIEQPIFKQIDLDVREDNSAEEDS